MWVEPAAVSRGEQQRWVGLRAMKRLKSSVCQIEKHSCESGEVWTSWLSFQSVTREAERFQFELPVRKKSRCLRFQEFVFVCFLKWRRLKDFFGNFLHKTRVSKWADSPSSWEEVLAFSSSQWRKLITETQQGLSASSAALMKPLLLLSFWSSGPEVYIFVLVWSHAWISTLLFEVGLFPSSLAAARSAEEWVMAGKMERKQDGNTTLDLLEIYHLFNFSCHYFLISSVLWNNSVARLENRIRICSVHLWNLITFLLCGFTLWRRKIFLDYNLTSTGKYSRPHVSCVVSLQIGLWNTLFSICCHEIWVTCS